MSELTTIDKLNKIMQRCKASVNLAINIHRDYHMSVIDYLKEKESLNIDPLEIDDNIKKIMIETNTIIELHFYPLTPNGFYEIFHYSLNKILDEGLKILNEIEEEVRDG